MKAKEEDCNKEEGRHWCRKQCSRGHNKKGKPTAWLVVLWLMRSLGGLPRNVCVFEGSVRGWVKVRVQPKVGCRIWKTTRELSRLFLGNSPPLYSLYTLFYYISWYIILDHYYVREIGFGWNRLLDGCGGAPHKLIVVNLCHGQSVIVNILV